MKISQLNKIIKESIKELIAEQGQGPCPSYPIHQWKACPGVGITSVVSIAYAFWPGGSQNNSGNNSPDNHNCTDNVNFYQSVGSPQVGQIIRVEGGNYNPNPGTPWCWEYMGTNVNPTISWFGIPIQFTNPQSFGPFSDCASCNGSTTSSCDQTPTSACAQQWFGNNASNFANWMSNKDCSNYQGIVNNLEQQAWDIMATATNPQQGPYNNWQDIKNAANASGLQQPQKGQFKRKAAKSYYSLCQITACNC